MTYHCELRNFFYQPKVYSRKDRWMVLLSEFDFKIKHFKGKENRVVDSLRRSVKMIHMAVVSTCETNVRERVKNVQETNEFFKTVTSYLKQDPTGIKYEGYQMVDEVLLTYINRLYIQSWDDLKRFIMDELYKRPYVGHLGYQKMITSIRKQFYWLGLKKDIVDYLAKCL
jgi:hypothetical protein